MVVFGTSVRFPLSYVVLIIIITFWCVETIDIKTDQTFELNVDEQFLKRISRHYCNHLTGTHVVLLAEQSAKASFYKVLQRSFHSSFYIHNEMTGDFSSSDYTVLFVKDEQFFLDESNYNNRFWHTAKTYLIISENKLKPKIVWSHVRRLWQDFKVFKVSLLHSDNLSVLRIFDRRFYKRTDTTDRKLNYGLHNMNKYPLRAVVFPRIPSVVYKDGEWTGPDWLTMEAFAKHMNFSLDLKILSEVTGFGSLMNGTYTGVLAEVAYGRTDISFNSRFMNDPMINKTYRYSNSNGWDFICFVVPTAAPLSRMEILFKTFTLSVWLCVAVTYALMTKSFQLFNKLQSLDSGGDQKISDPFMTSIQVVLGMGICSLPKHAAGRLMLVSCSAACFVIVSLFQASMVTKLSIETGQKDIDTLEELDQSGMEIRTSLKAVRDALSMYSYTKSLADKIDLKKARRNYIKSKFVFTGRIMSLNSGYANYVGHFENHSVELHIVKECPLKYYVTYPVALGFPFLDQLNDVITRFVEAGISIKWRVDITKLQQEYYKQLITNTDVLKSYSMHDLWFAFVLLFSGYVISMVLLVFEFVLNKIFKK